MDTPNGLNPVVLDFQVEQQMIPVPTVRGGYSNIWSNMTCRAKIQTDKPMWLGEKYPPLLDITVGGRRANLIGIVAIKSNQIPSIENNFTFINECVVDCFEWVIQV